MSNLRILQHDNQTAIELRRKKNMLYISIEQSGTDVNSIILTGENLKQFNDYINTLPEGVMKNKNGDEISESDCIKLIMDTAEARGFTYCQVRNTKKKTYSIVACRRVCAKVLRNEYDLSYPQIARLLNQRSHAAIIRYLKYYDKKKPTPFESHSERKD